jgi:hypothetical protein
MVCFSLAILPNYGRLAFLFFHLSIVPQQIASLIAAFDAGV